MRSNGIAFIFWGRVFIRFRKRNGRVFMRDVVTAPGIVDGKDAVLTPDRFLIGDFIFLKHLIQI